MVLPLLISAALTAGPAVRLASPGFDHVGVDDRLSELFSDHLAQQLVLSGISVITKSEISQLIGLERQRQLLNCSDAGGQCLVELANAIGVDGLVTGTVGKLESGFVVNVKIVSSRDGHALAAASGRFKTDSDVIDWLTRLGPGLAATLRGERRGEPRASVRSRAWLPLVGGGALALAGAGLLLTANLFAADIRGGGPGLAPQLSAKLESGQLFEKLGWVGLGVGAAGLGAAALMYLLGGDEAPRVAALLSPRGGLVSVEVSFP